MEELIKVKEELKEAKEKATQSWLDSRPLIDELERLKQVLARAEKRHKNMYSNDQNDTLVFDLQSQLESINQRIKSKKKEEVNATMMVNEMKYCRDLDRLRDEMEELKLSTAKKRQSKLKLKRASRLRKQRLRSLHLALAASREEAEAYGASAAETTQYMDLYNSAVSVVRLSHEEYQGLRKRFEESDSIATWRVSVAEGEKLAAESRRDLALAKLKEVKAGKLRLMMRERNDA
ncbi:hypothetical protein G4B88_017391 [Cannabis sativa]|uniref:Uncharacterized protein n=1 Tax=Cannabis sativa TaxID=3483 RepID=A0A7J6I4C6_CANSA|nr:hypothetical protein G4B88_017391 [Cannabis sativa]